MNIEKVTKLIKKGETQKIAQILQDPSFNVNQIDPKTGKTLLQVAIESQQSQIFQMLLKNSHIRLDTLSKSGQTILQTAILMNSPQYVEMILRAKMSTKVKNSSGHSAMYTAIKNKTNPQIIRKLLFHNCDVNQPIQKYGSLLNLATICNQFQNFGILLQKNQIDLKVCDEQDNTTLLLAVKQKKGQFVQALLKRLNEIPSNKMSQMDKQFYINMADKNGDNALHIAAKKDYQAILELLLREGKKLGIDQQLKNKQGKTYKMICQQLKAQKQKSKQNQQYQQRKRQQQKRVKHKQKQQQRIRLIKQQQLQRQVEKTRRKQEQLLEAKKRQLSIQMEKNRKIWIGTISLVVIIGIMYLVFLRAAANKPTESDSF